VDYQPAYVEFASVFLLVLVLKYRYDLSVMDLGISTDSFVARFISESRSAQNISDMPPEQEKKISVWFKALLNEDSIDDDVLSTFKPQEFYLCLSTLVSQIFYASASGLISVEQLKTLLECTPIPPSIP
jgi:mediator of RNA polymerase II transcription subunit 5